ncbi:contact-dependent growth inhibition system immunity protein [Kitasatospora sp. NPDC052896]|uniref:contact-dependent growth inhibition system immunity protein n=1 Tax=Kitasatospora sp. NPDC052896 TaxID=3364061 RepID=UPI0037CB319F
MKPRDDFDEDFGLSGLTKYVRSPWVTRSETAVLDLVGDLAERYGRVYAEEVLRDIQRLLAAPLPDEVLNSLWLAATGAHFDPAGEGLDIRTWLSRIAEVCIGRIRQDDPTFVSTVLVPAPETGLREAILEEIRGAAPALTEKAVTSTYPAPLPDVVPALRAVTEIDPDLGFRLFLRAMKVYFVPISEARWERFNKLGERFGYNEFVVDDGNLNIWSDLVD